MKYFLCLFFIPLFSAFAYKQDSYPTVYEVSMPEPHTHYFEVKVTINDKEILSNPYVELRMPTWTPGSYLIREFARNVQEVKAVGAANTKLSVAKTLKSTWKVQGHEGKPITFSYRVYAFEMTVRTSFLDDSHGYINGGSVFMYVPELKNKKSLVKIEPHASFGKVSVALPEVKKNQFEAENYDLLVDSPFEIGNHEILEFEALGVKHKIANYSMEPLDYDRAKVVEDYKKVVLASHSIFGGKHPCKEYLFIIHHLPGIGGGLEHLNSTTCHTTPGAYQDSRRYESFMGLIAHEYFHLWNVKRLRPVALGPFDYENENYTNMLWVAEGFTNYYQSDILKRGGLIDEERMLALLAGNIGNVENQYGNKIQAVAESSWDAWIKFYRPNENSANSTISYYNKGGILANILNMIIIGNTNGQKSLDNVLQNLYNDLYLKKDIGFTDEEFIKECEKVSGQKLEQFFYDHVYGTEPIDYKKYFAMVDVDANLGLANPGTPYFGAMVGFSGGKVARVDFGTGAYEGGINVNDEIVEVDGKRFTGLSQITDGKKVGDKVKITVSRANVRKTYEITLKEDPRLRVTLTPKRTASEQKKYNKWMHVD